MLFNSFAFLFAYLPVVLAGYFLLDRWAPAASASASWRRLAPATWLALASLFFYAWWDVRYLPLLLVPPAVGVMVYAADIAADFWAIAGALVLSLLISMAFVGVLMQRLLKGHSHPQERP